MGHLQQKYGVSERRACRVIGQHRSTQRYTMKVDRSDDRLIAAIHEIVRKRPRFGYRRVTLLLRRDGWQVNRKRIYRLWRKEGFKVPRNARKRRAVGHSNQSCTSQPARQRNDVWAWDLTHGRTSTGVALKWLSVIDEFTRECLALVCCRSCTAADAVKVLDRLAAERGWPRAIRSDNGPEFISKLVRRWAETSQSQTLYVAPGSPWENGFAESFHSRFKDEFVFCEELLDLREARELTSRWRDDYNHIRPHSSLGGQTPAEFAASLGLASGRPPASLQPNPAAQPRLPHQPLQPYHRLS